jgi:hypothetical protein
MLARSFFHTFAENFGDSNLYRYANFVVGLVPPWEEEIQRGVRSDLRCIHVFLYQQCTEIAHKSDLVAFKRCIVHFNCTAGTNLLI